MSGISADDNAMDTYQKLSRSKIQYVVFKIDKVNGSETIVVEKEGVKGDQEEKWAEFVESMPETEGRFGVFDLQVDTPPTQAFDTSECLKPNVMDSG